MSDVLALGAGGLLALSTIALIGLFSRLEEDRT